MPKRLILFIHGLGGNPEDTWGNFGSLIQNDPKLKAAYDVAYYSYPTSIWPFSRSPKIQHLANGLKTEIDNRHPSYSSIILICHSLGGLVAKRYIIDQLNNTEALQVNGVVLFATPNTGAELIRIARYFPWYALWNRQLRQLCFDSDFIESLSTAWIQSKADNYVKLKYVLAGKDLIVSRKSAVGDAGYKDIETIIDEGHQSIVKPEDCNSLAFLVTKRFILNLSSVLTSRDKIRQALKRHTDRQISIQKRNGKYIPALFVDRGNLRDRIRYCAMPKLFSKKIVDDINHMDFRLVSIFLKKYPIVGIEFDFPKELYEPVNGESDAAYWEKLETWLLDKNDKLSTLANDAVCDINSSEILGRIPARNLSTFYHQKYSRGHAYMHRYKIENVLARLELLKAPGVVITSAAGRGKTNFLCDFIENVLNPRDIPILFLTVSELSREVPIKIWEYIATIALANRSYLDFDLFCKDYELLYLETKQPLIIIIDGLSEHRQLDEFITQLTLLTQELIAKPYFRIIYTCRSEYFNARFNDMAAVLESYSVAFIRDFEAYVTDAEKSLLLKTYFDHFKIKSNIRKSAHETLTADPLFLRVFCETYGNPSSQLTIELPPINDVYKERVFRDFLDRKEKEIISRTCEHPIKNHQRIKILKNLLKKITAFMVRANTFANIPLDKLELTEKEVEQLLNILDEDILLRKDLATSTKPGSFDTNSEVLNFTMDEFRDFFIADYLITIALPKSAEKFQKLIDVIVTPECLVAEGVGRFLYRMGKAAKTKRLIELLESQDWYNEVMLNEIFEIDDDFVTEMDIQRISGLFTISRENIVSIILGLGRRIDKDIYPNLNASLLQTLCYSLTDDQYCDLIAPVLISEERRNYHANSPCIIIDSYIDKLKCNLEDSCGKWSPSLAIEVSIVVFCLSSFDQNVARKAHSLLLAIAIDFTDVAERLFLQYLQQLRSSIIKEQLLLVIRGVYDISHLFSDRFYANLSPHLKEGDYTKAETKEIVRSIKKLAANK